MKCCVHRKLKAGLCFAQNIVDPHMSLIHQHSEKRERHNSVAFIARTYDFPIDVALIRQCCDMYIIGLVDIRNVADGEADGATASRCTPQTGPGIGVGVNVSQTSW